MGKTTKHGWESEAALAAKVIQYLKADGWEVFQEVEAPSGIADIVARKGSVLWVIEAKLTFSFHLFEQATRWLPYAWHVSVAIPEYNSRRCPEGWNFGMQLARNYGIGVFKCPFESFRRVIHMLPESRSLALTPEQHCKALNNRLHEKQKTFSSAGSPGAKRWTPFKDTAERIEAFVKANPGCTLDECASGVTHHYASKQSFKQSILGLIPKGVFTFSARVPKGRKDYCLFPT